MTRPTVAEVDLSAIVHNLRALRSLSGPSVKTIAVVKADAYGLGAAPICRALAQENVDMFAVALLEEAVALRDADVEGRIIILGAPFPQEAAEIVAFGFEPVVSDMAMARSLDAAARKHGTRVPAHLKFDTGMRRLGFPWERGREVASEVAALSGLRLVGAMTHFPSADERDSAEFTREQMRTFRSIRDQLMETGITIPTWHAANSAGVLWFPESHLDAVRPGLSLYGTYPSRDLPPPVELRQALTLKTRIAQVRDVPEGSTVSYGRTFRADRPSRIAVLPIGYADGFSRMNSNRGQVLVHGRRTPVVGRVCMDLTMVDVTDLPKAAPGDEVVLYGSQGQERISIEEVANRVGTIGHDVLTAISRRVPRAYVDSGGGSSGGAPTR